jgi:hypothetical protein
MCLRWFGYCYNSVNNVCGSMSVSVFLMKISVYFSSFPFLPLFFFSFFFFVGYLYHARALRLCLAMEWARPVQKISLKINRNILTFYITSVIFYYYSNKKIITKQNFLLFCTKYSYFFSHINQICYNTGLLSQIHSFAKHNLNVGVICVSPSRMGRTPPLKPQSRICR